MIRKITAKLALLMVAALALQPISAQARFGGGGGGGRSFGSSFGGGGRSFGGSFGGGGRSSGGFFGGGSFSRPSPPSRPSFTPPSPPRFTPPAAPAITTPKPSFTPPSRPSFATPTSSGFGKPAMPSSPAISKPEIANTKPAPPAKPVAGSLSAVAPKTTTAGSFSGATGSPTKSFSSGLSSVAPLRSTAGSFGSSSQTTPKTGFATPGLAGAASASGRKTPLSSSNRPTPPPTTHVPPPTYHGIPASVHVYGYQSYHVFPMGGFYDHSFAYLAPHPAWYYYMPYHGAYWVNPPVAVNGGYAPGGINWGNVILFIVVVGGIVFLIRKLVIPRITGQMS